MRRLLIMLGTTALGAITLASGDPPRLLGDHEGQVRRPEPSVLVAIPVEQRFGEGVLAVGSVLINRSPLATEGDDRFEVRVVAVSVSFVRDGRVAGRVHAMPAVRANGSEPVEIIFSGGGISAAIRVGPLAGRTWGSVVSEDEVAVGLDLR